MGSRSHQLNRGAAKVHMAYQRNAREEARAGVESRAEEDVPPPCAACTQGRHSRHTCARQLKAPRAAPGTAGATAARIGAAGGSADGAACAGATAAPPDDRLHMLRPDDDLSWIVDPEATRANVLAAQAAERQRAAQAERAAQAAAASRGIISSAAAATATVATTTAMLLTSPVRALYRAAWRLASTDVITAAPPAADAEADAADADVPGDADDAGGADDAGDADDADRDSPAAAIRGFERLLTSSKNVPPAVLAAMHEMREGLNRGGPLPDWARRGYEYEVMPPLRYDERGMPIEPEPADWSAARRRAYVINLEKTRPKQLAEGKVACPLCAGKTKPVQYSLSLGNRTGIVPIVENDASFSYVAAMQRQCGSGQCGCIFFDYDALAQLPAGERSSLPFSAEMATGELFIGRALEQDIALAMTKGLGAATIASIMRIKAHERYDVELAAYLEHGAHW